MSLEGYALLKVAGKIAGLEGLRKELSARFNKTHAPNATCGSDEGGGGGRQGLTEPGWQGWTAVDVWRSS